MNRLLAPASLLAAVLASSAAPAQTDDADLAEASQRLRAAIEKTRALDALAFKSLESQDDAFRRQFPVGAGGGEDVQVSGTWCGGVTRASVGYDDDEVYLANGRMVARTADGPWKLRRNCLADGQPLPHVADPGLTFEVLAALPDEALKVKHVESGKVKDVDVTIYGFSVDGARAQDLALSGLLPRASGGRMLVMIGGGGGMRTPPPDVSIDFAVSVDPKTGLVHRVHCKAYTVSNLPDNVQVRFAGADGVEIGGDEDEKDEEPPAAKDAPPTYSKGLPKRRLAKNVSLTEFDLVLSKHGEATLPELPADARKSLGLRE